MIERSHSKIHRQIQLAADGRLTPSQQQALDIHLAGCAECRLYVAEIRALETRLSSVSLTRLAPPKPRAAAQQVAAIQASYRRHTMKKNVLSVAGALAAFAVVIVSISLLSRLAPGRTSSVVEPTATALNEMPTPTIAAAPALQSQPLRYFTRAESDVLPLQPWQLTPSPVTPTPHPDWTFDLSIQEAQQQAGFEVLVPGWLPEPTLYGRASYQPDHNIVRIFYPRRADLSSDYGFVLQVERGSFSDDCDDLCGVVGLGAQVEAVQVGEFQGEYVTGAWVFTENGPGWDYSAPQKALRWQANGMAYELTYGGGTTDVFEDDLIAIAESLDSAPQYQFFKQAASDTRPVETEAPGADTAWVSDLSIAEAEQLAGFDVLEPTWLPEDLVFSGTSVNPEQRTVWSKYFYTPNDPEGNGFTLVEQLIPDVGIDCELCTTLVGASAVIEQVQIGDIPAEYVANGVWQAIDDTRQWGWSADPPIQKLRWQANGVVFGLSTVAGVSRDELFSIAESIVSPSAALSGAAPFAAIEPTWLPEGYTLFNSKTLDSNQTTCLYYRGRGDDDEFPSLVIAQSHADLPAVEQLRDPLYVDINIKPEDIPISREAVLLGGASGEAELIETGMDASQLCGGTRLPMGKILIWQASDQHFALFTQSNAWWDVAYLTRLEMRRVAESMTGVSTIAEDILDPERLPSIEFATALSGFAILEPAALPDGYQFAYAAYWQNGDTRNVLLIYRANDVLLGFNILQTSEPTETLEARWAAAPEIYEKVIVNNQTAWYSLGECWDENNKPFSINCGAPQSLTWFENGLRYRIEGFMPKETMMEIAEGMR